MYNDFVCDTLVLMINVEKNSSWAFDNYFKMRGQKFKRTVGELDVLI